MCNCCLNGDHDYCLDLECHCECQLERQRYIRQQALATQYAEAYQLQAA